MGPGRNPAQVGIFPALLVICSVVEPTLITRDLPLFMEGRSHDFPEVCKRVPPISIGLTCPADTAGWGNILCYDERREGRSSFYYIDDSRSKGSTVTEA